METSQVLDALSALAQPTRLAAFRALVQAGPDGLAVGALRERLDGVPAATLSAHLNVLRRAGLVADAREGRTIHVSARFAQVDALIAYLTENCCAGAACEASPRRCESPRP